MRYNGLEVFYKGSGGVENAIVLLHGWGASSGAMDGIYNYLCRNGKSVYAIDFPGFGNSDEPPEDWGVYDYADCAQFVIESLGLVKPVAVGHSFGGRVALILAARKKVSKIVLADSAGLKPKISLKKRLAIRRYKAAKRKGKQTENAGSDDYRALSPSMRKVFVRVVNTHLNSLLPRIDVPALIFWGKEDKDTPPYMARKLNKGIKDSGLIMLDGAGHFAYAERHDVFNAAVRAFTE